MRASTNNISISAHRRLVENTKRKVEEYTLVKIIGTGTFGKVYLATLGNKNFAMKILHKRMIIELEQIDHIKNEKDVLASI